MASASRRTERPVAIVAGGSTGIDPAVSLALGIDHGLAQVCSTPAWITGLGVASSIAPADRLAADLVGVNRGSTL
jgi:hypothetical protein